MLYLGSFKWQLLMKMADLQKRKEKLEIYLFHQQIVLNDYCVLNKIYSTGNTRTEKSQHAVSSHEAQNL